MPSGRLKGGLGEGGDGPSGNKGFNLVLCVWTLLRWLRLQAPRCVSCSRCSKRSIRSDSFSALTRFVSWSPQAHASVLPAQWQTDAPRYGKYSSMSWELGEWPIVWITASIVIQLRCPSCNFYVCEEATCQTAGPPFSMTPLCVCLFPFSCGSHTDVDPKSISLGLLKFSSNGLCWHIKESDYLRNFGGEDLSVRM